MLSQFGGLLLVFGGVAGAYLAVYSVLSILQGV